MTYYHLPGISQNLIFESALEGTSLNLSLILINLVLAILYSTYFCPQGNGARAYEEKDPWQLEGRIPSEFLHYLAKGKKIEAYLWILESPNPADLFLLELCEVVR